MKINPVEGDLIKDLNGIIFDVKGLIHPPGKVIAFPRFIPDLCGYREYKGVTYSKVYSFSERFKFLEQNFPDYMVHDSVFDEVLCEVPIKAVERHFKPVEKLDELRASKSLDALESLALKLVELLKKAADVSWDAIGVSGSIMVGLHTSRSDIDPIIYGSGNCRRVYSALKGMFKDKGSPFKPYTIKDLKTLFDSRSKDTVMDFEDFVVIESRKVLQGKFMGKDYFIRFVKDWNEIAEKYGDIRYKNFGYAKIEATIADDSESIFTPCVYKIENVRVIEGPKFQPVEEIASFRGRFCEQAKIGEVVVAQGKLERVADCRQDREHFRLLLGNKPSDYMALSQQSSLYSL